MAQIKIDSCTLSKSGKSHVIKSGGNTFYAKPEQGLDKHIGDTIEAKVTTSEYNGAEMVWINEYKVTQDSFKEPSRSPSALIAPAPAWQPFASNVVAQAVLAGHIKQPSEIKAWVDAVKAIMEPF